MRKEGAAKEKQQKEAVRALEQIEAVSIKNINCFYLLVKLHMDIISLDM